MLIKIVPPLAAIGAAIVFSLSTSGTAALACNPDDCRGISKEELARDTAEIKRLNREQKRHVDQRDAEYAKGWQARREHQAAMTDYERRMAEWREAVRRCNAGEYRYCER